MNTQLLHGDCREVLKTLPDNSVNMCCTSPPYFGLRSYGIGMENGEIGLEPTPDAYVAELVSVFREVKRVLRDDGTLWLNLGDSYSSGGRDSYDKSLVSETSGVTNRSAGGKRVTPEWAKPKDLLGIPWMVAFALRADGWYLRQDIIWHKPNPMPESVTDRCTKAHEYVFLLSKSERYYYDAEAIKEESSGLTGGRFGAGGKEVGRLRQDSARPRPEDNGTRNKRSVWTVNTHPYKEAHFATFPPALITPMILAGCPVGGTVLDPFGGSGTTGEVAESLGRNSILIELNPAYIEIQGRRTAQMGMEI